jgi:hypothetical protein
VKLDKIVLQFSGFFKEAVVESNLENYRIRQVIIYYYLEDSTIMITEPKEMNSGIPQGVFLKRQGVMKTGTQDILVPADFFIGETVEIYGRQFKITDADTYTREFFKSAMKTELPNAIQVPEDNFKKSSIPVVTKKDKAMIDFLEHSLGGGKVAS